MKSKWRKDWSKATEDEIDHATNTLRGMCKAEHARGNTGLAVQLDGAAYALDRLSTTIQFEHVVYDLKLLLRWKMSYESLWWPSSPYMPVKEWSRLHQWFRDMWDALTWKMNWDPGIYPSYPTCLRHIVDNIHRFVCWWVLPWRRWRWRFMEFFVNHNGSKLLDCAASWAYIRNREADCCYYEMRFTGLHYKLIRTRWLDNEGAGRNTFLTALCSLGDDDGGEAAKLYKEEKVICSGWVFGVKSFVREMDKVVEATPDLDWTKSW